MGRFVSRVFIVLLFLSAGVLLSASSAEAVLITFDDQPPDTIITVQYAGLGVIFSTTNPLNPMTTDDDIPGPPFTPPNSVDKPTFTDPLARYRADFTVPVSMVKVTVGDFAPSDTDNVFLRAFDALNNQIAETLGVVPGDLSGGIDLVVSVPGIAHVEWGSQLTDTFPNSIFTDNFEFNAEVVGVGEPSTLLLLGAGLAAVAQAKRSRRTRTLA